VEEQSVLWNGKFEAQRKDFIARKYAEQGSVRRFVRGSMEDRGVYGEEFRVVRRDLRVGKKFGEEIGFRKQKQFGDGSLAAKDGLAGAGEFEGVTMWKRSAG